MIRKLLFTAAALFVGKKLMDRARAGSSEQTGGHVPTDLQTGHHPGPGERAAEPFRPDVHASPSPQEREGMRPATMPANEM